MVGTAKFSFSCRGFSSDASDDDIRQYFEAVGTIVSWKRVPTPGYPSCSVYVNFSQVNSVNDVLSLNGTVPSFNKGFPISVRQQAVLVAQVVTALDEIKFSVSMRGLSWKASEEQIREALNKLAKLHSLRINAPPAWVVCDAWPAIRSRFINIYDLQNGVTTKQAYANFSGGEIAAILALDGTSPHWNYGSKMSVRAQVSPRARHSCKRPGLLGAPETFFEPCLASACSFLQLPTPSRPPSPAPPVPLGVPPPGHPRGQVCGAEADHGGHRGGVHPAGQGLPHVAKAKAGPRLGPAARAAALYV